MARFGPGTFVRFAGSRHCIRQTMPEKNNHSLITRRSFVLAAGGVAACSDPASIEPTLGDDPLVARLLYMSDEQLARLEEGSREGLLELAPVSLPPDPEALNNHYGWPVGTQVGDTLIVAHRHIPGHWTGLERTDDNHSYAMVVRSTDGGKTWTRPYDLRQAMTREDRYRGGHIPLAHRYKFAPDQDPTLGYKIHLNAIGTTSDGGVVIVSDHGVFRSDDQGQTWKHFSTAMREDTTPGAVLYIGPRLFEHPDYGLVVVGHSNIVTEDYKKGPHPPDTTGGNRAHRRQTALPLLARRRRQLAGRRAVAAELRATRRTGGVVSRWQTCRRAEKLRPGGL